MKFSIRLLYLYLFSAIGLFICIIGLIRLIDLGMKVYVFKDADKYAFTQPLVMPDKIAPGKKQTISDEEIKRQNEEAKRNQETENMRNRQRETSGALAMILIGIPVYLYHWKTITKENKKNK